MQGLYGEDNNESLNDLLKRLTKFIKENLTKKVDIDSPNKNLNILVITHPCVAKEFVNAFHRLRYNMEVNANPKR